MIFEIIAKGHENIRSNHKSTFEITTDSELTPKGDCIIGVSSNKTMNNFPEEFREKIKNSSTEIHVILDTENGHDEIVGYGDENLNLTHSSDIVCRKSNYICNRTLMINSNKAAKDLDKNLIKDLQQCMEIKVTIKLI